MKTFIEIWHKDSVIESNWFATRSVTRWNDSSDTTWASWQIAGSTIYVHDEHDIAALRKLLDAIESELDAAKKEADNETV